MNNRTGPQKSCPGRSQKLLSRADADLVSRESAIPGFATVLDADALVTALRARYPGIGLQQAEPFYVHYKPGRRCMVAFWLTTKDSDVRLLAYADAYGIDAAVKLQKARELAQDHASPLGPGVMILEACGVALYLFPLDRKLRGLWRLTQPRSQRKLWHKLFREQLENADCTLKYLRYKPERRYVGRLDTADGPRAVIKLYNDYGYRAAKRAAYAFSSRGMLHILPIQDYVDRYGVLAFNWHPGCPLQDLLRAEVDGVKAGKEAQALTGAALAELHDQTSGIDEYRNRNVEVRRLEAQVETIGKLCPHLHHVAEQLARSMMAWLDNTPQVTVALHGDFNAQQVLIDNEPRATIIDLDWAVLGNPAADLGGFIGHLERDVLRGTLQSSQVGRITHALIEGYGSVRPVPPASIIQLYAAIGLFYQAAEPFRYREPDWPARIEVLLARTGEILGYDPFARKFDFSASV